MSRRTIGPGDLVLSHFSLSAYHPIEDRVAAASTAGFAGIGLFLDQVARLNGEGFDAGRLAELLDGHGVVLADLEGLSVAPPPKYAELTAEHERLAFALADRFHCRNLQVIGPARGEPGEIAAALAALCDRAADHGLVVSVEYLPFTAVRTAEQAMAVVERADRANGGICVDLWHHVRGAADPKVFPSIPPDRITAIQISDGPEHQELDSYYEDCLRRRLPPGDGQFDIEGFVTTVTALGVELPWAVEVCQESVWDQPALLHLQRCASGMRRFLEVGGA